MSNATSPGGSDTGSVDPPLVGRVEELEEIGRAVDAVAGGAFRGLALIGEPGIGKTALAEAACGQAKLAGLATVSGHATEFETGAPFGMFLQALDRTLGEQDPARLAELGEDHLRELAAVFPSLAGQGPGGPPGLQSERFRLHYAVKAALEQLAAERPLLLSLDDVHWADRSSLELLAYLLRHGVSAPVLLLYAYRPRYAPELLVHAAAAAAREDSVTALELDPLTLEEADSLLGTDLEPGARAALYLESGGNPFYLMELSRVDAFGESLADEHHGDDPDDAASVPFGVRAAIAQEVGATSPTARALLNAAGIIGQPFDLRLAARVAELDEPDALNALDELVRLGLIRTTEVPGRYSFRHPIVRRVIYGSAGARFTLAAHQRAAGVLEEWGSPLITRAHHVERSAPRGDGDAVDLLTAAAQETAPRAPATAARWLTTALRLLPRDAPPERRLELLISLATALGTSGRVDESRAALVEALPLLRVDEVVLRGRLVGTIARLGHMLARHGGARELLERAIADAGPEPSAGSTALKVELAMDYWIADDDREGLVVAARAARRDAEAIGDRVSYATAAGLEAVGCGYLGQLEAALAAADDAALAVDELSDAELAVRIEALVVLSHAESGGIQRVSDGARHAARGVAIARATGQDAWYPMLMSLLCVTSLFLGRLPDARQAAEAALESGRLGNAQAEIWALTLTSWVNLLEGDTASAVAYAEEAVAIVERGGTTLYNWLAYGCLARALLKGGEPVRARDMILEHAGGPELELVERGWVASWYAILGLAELDNGDVDAAREWIDRSLAAAAAFPTESLFAEARYCRAALAIESGEPAVGAELALQASEGFAAAERAIDAARARALAGQALGKIDDHEGATRLLQQARAELDACGARGYRDEASRELRRLGERAPRLDRRGARQNVGPEVLSAREREVADLVARGMTNRQIAEELFVSPKTIESHLSHIFEKAGVPSRAAVAATVERWRREGAG